MVGAAAADRRPFVVIDRTHLGRRASGLERITRDLFADDVLQPLKVAGTRQGGGRLPTALRQLVLNPLEALRQPDTVWIFPGFPPSPLFARLADRTILYVHDLFLIERTADLNRAARYYMAPSFRFALRRFRWFLANSATTADRLARYVDPAATVQLYRPPARDVLGLRGIAGSTPGPDQPIRIGMIGTVEPRKNYGAAVAIRSALAARLDRAVELHIVGRPGWGSDGAALAGAPGVVVHDYVADAAMPALVAGWTLFLSTSHDEGLGLPLLEIQHAGLPIVVPDKPVFREVLGQSGIYIDPARPDAAAAGIADALREHGGWFREAGRQNIDRWNRLASHDRVEVFALLASRLDHVSRS